jgi:hypothetical protein
MKHRNLRIAWSAGWGLLAVLLCVLWVRSYWLMDLVNIDVPSPYALQFESAIGRTSAAVYESEQGWDWHQLYPEFNQRILRALSAKPRFYLSPRKDAWIVGVPHWFLLLIVFATGAVPWLPYRFSLRTLLIATTLVAVVLGVIVWLATGDAARRELAAMVLAVTIVCLVFFIGLRPLEDRNYGGMTSGLRWMFWCAPLWLLVMIPAADRLARSVAGQSLAAVLLTFSVLSASYPTWNPWTHPWIYNWIEWCGLV